MPTTTDIHSWKADYTGADTNTPQNSTAIPYPAVQTTDLGQVLRDRKAVIRQESLNKGWYPDSVPATYVSNTTFKTAGDVRATYPTGAAIKFTLGAVTRYTFIVDASFASGNTTFTTSHNTLNAALTTFTVSPFLPSSNPINIFKGYTPDVGSSLPWRCTQIGRIYVADGSTGDRIMLAQAEPDTNYTPLLQAVLAQAGPPSNGSLRYNVQNLTQTTFNFTLGAASGLGAGNSLIFDYAIVRVV